MNKADLYKKLYSALEKANPETRKQQLQADVNTLWRKAKSQGDDFEQFVNDEILKAQRKTKEKKGTLLKFWTNVTTASTVSAVQPTCPAGQWSDVIRAVFDSSSHKKYIVEKYKNCSNGNAPLPSASLVNSEPSKSLAAECTTKKAAPAQLADINDELLLLQGRMDRGFLDSDDQKRYERLKIDKKATETELKKKQGDQQRSQQRRDNFKLSLKSLKEKIPESSQYLTIRESAGRPRIEEKQPEIVQAIVDIACYGSAAHERRRDESYGSVKNLDDLVGALHAEGFTLSRSAAYLRLIPRRANTAEGKLHKNPANVKLKKPTNNKHTNHQDGRFCTSAINMGEELASLLGPKEVFFLSQDDKARVPLGLTAASKQAPCVMHMEYPVKMPDHDFVVANRHKLIPSVYAGIQIRENGMGRPEAVGYTGPTYIAIRSGKHSSSTALSHGLDYTRLLGLAEFDELVRTDGMVKPVHVVVTDGGPDENPRYQKVIRVAVHHFAKHDLDAMFLLTNAPGRSAYNRVERRMAPLTRELTGVLIEHDHFGSHLDSQLRTKDLELEKKNFAHAGQVLASIWSDVKFDGFPVHAEYVDPDDPELIEEDLVEKDGKWYAIHVRTSQYALQIVKCDDRNCCKPRSSYFSVFPRRFLPPPMPLFQTEFGLKAPTPGNTDGKQFAPLFVLNSLNLEAVLPNSIQRDMPFDTYCPSLLKKIKERTCKVCQLYVASNVMLKQHAKIHRKDATEEKIRPKRLLCRRKNDALVVIDEGETEWIDTEDLDDPFKDSPRDPLELTPEDEAFPVLTIEERMDVIWSPEL